VPVTFGWMDTYEEAFTVGFGVVPYIGFGFAFGL
jgi:hypothetical protein